MKITFNLGAISFNAKKEPREATPDDIKAGIWPAQGVDVSFSMDASSYTLEAEPGEIPAIYKEVMPALTEMMKTFAVLKS